MTWLVPSTEAETRVALVAVLLFAFGVGLTAGTLTGRRLR